MNRTITPFLAVFTLLASQWGGMVWSREIGIESAKIVDSTRSTNVAKTRKMQDKWSQGARLFRTDLAKRIANQSLRPEGSSRNRIPQSPHAEICAAHEYTFVQSLNSATAMRIHNLLRESKANSKLDQSALVIGLEDVREGRAYFQGIPDLRPSMNATIRLVASNLRPHAPPLI